MKTALHELVLVAGCALALCGYETASHAGTDRTSADHILAIVQPEPAAASTFIDLSADRRVLFIAGAKDDRSGKIAETQLSVYDVANPASPHLLSALPLGDIRKWQVVASGERLLIQHGWNDPKRPFGVTIVDVHDASHPVVTGNVALAGSLALSRDSTTAQIRSYWPEEKQIAFKLDRPEQPLPDNRIPLISRLCRDRRSPSPGNLGMNETELGHSHSHWAGRYCTC